jgi:hypothetical protein
VAGRLAQPAAGDRSTRRRPTRPRRRRLREKLVQNLINYLVWTTYLGVGIALSASNRYFDHLSGVRSLTSAVLAVVLWPVIILGANLHL